MTMVRKGNLAVFEGSNISETRMAIPTKIGVHASDIKLYLHYFFVADSDRLNFLMTMDYSPWLEREIWPFLKVAISPKPEWPCPPKLVCMHLTSSYTCMIFLSRFLMIELFDDHGLYSSWSEREIWPFLKVAISPKPEKLHQPKLVCMHLTSIPTCINVLSQFRSIEFFDDRKG